MDITKAIALVTGGANGLGKAITEDLLSHGATVIVLDRDQAALDALEKRDNLHTRKVDLLDTANLLTVLQEIFAQHKVSVLVNNAGILHNKPLVSFGAGGFNKLSEEEWDLVLGINLRVPFLISREVAEQMVKTRTKGVIVNISSIAAVGNAGQSAYSASKAAIESFSMVIAKELGIFGIRAAAVAPGFMNTESTHDVMNEDHLKHVVKNVPLRRLGKAEEVAAGVRFVVENDFFTGKVLSVDGGLTL